MEEGVKGREKCEEEGEGRGDPKPSHLFEWREKEKFFYFHFWKLLIFMCFDKMVETRLQENVKQWTILNAQRFLH
jgi:hypothetical protein